LSVEVGQEHATVGVAYKGAERDTDNEVLAVFPVLVFAPSVLTPFGTQVMLVNQVT